ncbi:SCO family protein [Auraticoccus monumenti]|uniref:Protein SCO1/2 n=1 Tax=Auraticoccus monumenti TaxID=675864 RepID=A0A1G7B4S2_9ACTN|nr:SCO family protein [Auraticoccus monumenti]SDE22003.1 protein SCO1/2 [Auraticoccus monumenti]
MVRTRPQLGAGAPLQVLAAWVLLVGLTLTTAGCVTGPERESAPADPDRYTGSWLSEGYPVPDVTLSDTSGGHFDVQTSPSRPVTVMFFGYTHCPESCTAVLDTLHSALDSLPDHLAGKVQVVVVSVDPDRDSPEALRTWLDRWDGSWIGLRGGLDEVRDLAGAVGVEVGGRRALPDGGYQVAHGAQLVGVDRDDTARLVWVEGTGVADLGRDLETFIKEQK